MTIATLLWTLLSTASATTPCDRMGVMGGTDDLGFVTSSITEQMRPSLYKMRFCDLAENRVAISGLLGQTTIAEYTLSNPATASVELRDSSDQPVPANIELLADGVRVTFTPNVTGTYYLVSTADTVVEQGERYNLSVAVDLLALDQAESPVLSMSELEPGGRMALAVNNAPPNALIYFAAARDDGHWCSADGEVCLGLQAPILLADGRADSQGSLVTIIDVPSQLPSGALLFQAVTISGGVTATTPVIATLN